MPIILTGAIIMDSVRSYLPAFIECGDCKKHSRVECAGAQVKCPHCGSTHVARMEIRDGEPEWFSANEAPSATTKVNDENH